MLKIFRITGLLILVALAGCQSNQQVKLYDGPARTASELVTVDVPDTLELVSINGQQPDSLGKRLIGREQQLQLLPGSYRIEAFYKDVWTPTGASIHEVLRSAPVVFTVNGQAGDRFALEYTLPENHSDASALAKDFQGWSRNLASGERQPSLAVTQSVGVAPAKPQGIAPLAGTASAPTAAPTTATAPAATPDQAAYLDLLKAYWSQASEQERREFLRWIAQ